MSTIHCSNFYYRPLLVAYYLIQLSLLNLLLTDPRITAQSAINNVELRSLIQQHQRYPNVQTSNVEHHLTENSNDEHNDSHDLDLYDEPLFFEESEFNEHNVDTDHHSPFKNVIHAAQLESVGLTLIPTAAIRPDQQNYRKIYLPAIIPVHKRSKSNEINNKTDSCSTEINSSAIYDLEAILWTLDQVNQLIAYKNGLIFNLAVIDSCSSPAILEKRLKTLFKLNIDKSVNKSTDPTSLPSFDVENIVAIVSSISSDEFLIAHKLLSPLNITLISAQDISFQPSILGNHAIQTALPIEYFASAVLQHLRQSNKSAFSVVYSNDSLSSSTMFDSLVKWITVENSKDNQLQLTKDGKEKKKAKQSKPVFCMQSILNVPSKLNTGEASQLLIQLQNEIKNNEPTKLENENIVLILTDSHTTREILVAYQHLINAGILNRLSFVLIKESNLNIVTGIESTMLNTLVIRESQKSLKDFVDYYEQLKPDNNLRNPFFSKYWDQSVNCGLNRDCLFDQIEPINTINSIQSTFALINSMITTKTQFCGRTNSKKSTRREDRRPATFCSLLNDEGGEIENKEEKLNSINNLKSILYDQLTTNELDLYQLSKHFNHAMKFSRHTSYPEKSVDVLKFRVVNQAYRFDRVANYLNSALIKDEQSKDATPSLTSLVVNHQLLACSTSRSTPYHSSLTRSNLINSASLKNSRLNNWSQSLWRYWYSIATLTSILSAIGALVSVICAIYFLFSFDYKIGSTILGYMILLGIFLLYVVNFFFLYPYSFMMCWAREYLMSISYTIILSSMLVKVMNHWRLNTYHNYNNLYIQHLNLVNANNNGFNNFNNLNQNTNLFFTKKLNSISTLMSMCLGLVSLESLTNLVWLAIYPPRPQQIVIDGLQQWKCYNIQFAVLIETDSIFSVLFAVLLILITIFFSALTWRHSSINSYESRWIGFSCYVMVITWTVWAFLFKFFHLVELRDLFIVIANLLVATSILICMFIRKLIIFYKLNRTKKYSNKAHHLASSPSISSSYSPSYSSSYNTSFNSTGLSSGSLNASYYGSVGRANSVTSESERKSNKKMNEQLKRIAKQSVKQLNKTDRSTAKNLAQMNQDNLDNVSTISAITTTSSIISSVKSYFTKNKQDQQHDQMADESKEPDFHLSSITTVDPHLTGVHQQQELYPMDVYETGGLTGSRSNQAQHNNLNSSQQPDSLFYTTKKSMFNSNHSLYLMDEKDYM